jgi:hypothetical protein
MQNSWCTEEGRDGGSAAKRWTQFQNRGSTSDQMVTPSSAHPDEMKTPDPNLLIDIDFDPPCVVNDKREVGERRPRDRSTAMVNPYLAWLAPQWRRQNFSTARAQLGHQNFDWGTSFTRKFWVSALPWRKLANVQSLFGQFCFLHT